MTPWNDAEAAYVHIPFCAHHCGYCDFAVAVGQDGRIDHYLDALDREMQRLGSPQPVRTLFFGGGTPTHLNHRQLERCLALTRRWLPLLPGHEFSVEANPTGLDAEKVRILADHGVNRVSLGVQSFQPPLLRVLERDHEPADVAIAVDAIRRRMPNFSMDLIFGVPGQTLPQWHDDLDRILAFEPTHVSTYGLTFEKGTKLWKQQQRGDVHSLDEETELAFYLAAQDRLEAAGFDHYEISNFARPGHQCQHNHVYWANHAHFGFGVGAAQYIDGVRTLNTRDTATYIKRALAGESTHFQSEQLEPRDRAMETVAIQLRRGIGIVRAPFREQTSFDLDSLVGPVIERLVGHGLLNDVGDAVRLTRRGKSLADAVVCELMKAS